MTGHELAPPATGENCDWIAGKDNNETGGREYASQRNLDGTHQARTLLELNEFRIGDNSLHLMTSTEMCSTDNMMGIRLPGVCSTPCTAKGIHNSPDGVTRALPIARVATKPLEIGLFNQLLPKSAVGK